MSVQVLGVDKEQAKSLAVSFLQLSAGLIKGITISKGVEGVVFCLQEDFEDVCEQLHSEQEDEVDLDEDLIATFKGSEE